MNVSMLRKLAAIIMVIDALPQGIRIAR